MPVAFSREPAILRPGPVGPAARVPFPDAPPPLERQVGVVWGDLAPTAKLTDDGVVIPLPDRELQLPALPTPPTAIAGAPVEAVAAAAGALTKAASKVAELRGNGDLSADGKARVAAIAVDHALVGVAGSMERIIEHEKGVDQLEAKLTDPPPAAADAVGLARHAEIRQRLAAMPVGDVIGLAAKLIEEGRGDEVVAAITSSPLPFSPEVEEHVRKVYAAHRLAANPEQADSLKRARDLATWARHSLGIVGAAVVAMSREFGDVDITEKLLAVRPNIKPDAAWPFAVERAQLEAARRRRAARSAH